METNHTNCITENTMDVIHIKNKEKNMDTIEKFYIHKFSKQNQPLHDSWYNHHKGLKQTQT
jgi:hypothetical protein